MARFFISDLHLGHLPIVSKYSRTHFSSIEDHDKTIVENIMNTLTKRDSLMILGDICFNKESIMYLEMIAEKIQSLSLCLGNHDLERSNMPSLEDFITVVGNSKKIFSMQKYKSHYWLTHAPLHPKELRGKYNIHGHVHDRSMKRFGFLDKRYINVSCENTNYFPINFDDIKDGWRTSI